MKKLKLITTILLSVMLIFTIATAVFADNEFEEDIWSDVETENKGQEGNNPENTENTENPNNAGNEQIAPEENIEVENTGDENEEYENLYTSEGSTTTNSENLADTGIADSSIFALIVVLSIIGAIYSAKKFNEYRNI